jgi:hypothetical protein
MRFSLAAATCAVSVALLAGCSTSPQGTSALPGSGVSAPQGSHVAPDRMYQPKGGINPKDLLRLQAEGKIPAPGGIKEAQKALRIMQAHPDYRIHPAKGGGAVGIWANMTYEDYIVGFPASGKKLTAAISNSSHECYEAFGLKVDSAQNIWIGCYEGGTDDTPTAQEYSKSGSLSGSYSFTCPSSWDSCDDYFYGYEGYDVAVNSSDVFQDGYFYGYNCGTGSCIYTYGYGIEYWPNGSPSSTPSLIQMPLDFSTLYVEDMYGMDLDSSGNLYVAFYGYCASNEEYGYGLLEITNPTSSPSISAVEPCGTYEASQAVYVSGGGSTMNVLDSEKREIDQYSLPMSEGASPSNVLGPTAPFGYPAGLGFNSTDKNVVSGDEYSWLNLGTVATNKWKQQKPVLLISDLFGSAYTPSDK